MDSIKYASAVGAVRAMEGSLLTRSDMERIANAADYREAADILVSCGKSAPEDAAMMQPALEKELCETWEFIRSAAPDCEELEILLYKNDFHNLKAALKALIMNEDAQRLFIRPTMLDLGELPKLVAEKRYEELPKYMRKAAEDAYNILTQSLDGQLADVVIDCACLDAMTRTAEKTDSAFMLRYSRLLTAFSDIKTAYRCSLMKKNQAFMSLAVCGSAELDKDTLIQAALGGTENLLTFLENTHFSEAAQMLRISPAAFEKWCDDELLSSVEEAKMQSFGAAPLEAYYLAKETEIKNLRIIISCKNCGASKEIIMERMRIPYV